MDLEVTLDVIWSFLLETPLEATLDIGGHFFTGMFLIQLLFPEFQVSKKVFFGFCVGLLPDFDYFSFGFIPHRTDTHTIWFILWAGVIVYHANKEDRYLECASPPPWGTGKMMLGSRWVRLFVFGSSLHLCLDFVFREGIAFSVMYFVTVLVAFVAQTIYNRKNKRIVPYKKTIKACVVVNNLGRFFVNEWTSGRLSPYDGKGFLEYKIPDNVCEEKKVKELVRALQEAVVPKKNFWEKIDSYFIRR